MCKSRTIASKNTFFIKLSNFLLVPEESPGGSRRQDLWETFRRRPQDAACRLVKERLSEQARDKYKSLSEEEKNKKREYGKNRYHNMSEEKKQGLKEYQKNYRQAKTIILKKKLLSIMQKTRLKKKKTRLKSTKEKDTKNWFNIKKKC